MPNTKSAIENPGAPVCNGCTKSVNTQEMRILGSQILCERCYEIQIILFGGGMSQTRIPSLSHNHDNEQDAK